MLKIWGRPAAINVQKVLWCADELGIAYENQKAGQHYGFNQEEFYLALNPNGKVPLLEHDGFALWESNSIIRYLCSTYSSSSLPRISTQDFFGQDKWLDWASSTLYYPTFRNYYLYCVRTPADQLDIQVVTKLKTQVIDILNIAENHLAKNEFLNGASFSMADFHLGVIVDKWEKIHHGSSPLPSISSYYSRLLVRESYRKNVAKFLLTDV